MPKRSGVLKTSPLFDCWVSLARLKVGERVCPPLPPAEDEVWLDDLGEGEEERLVADARTEETGD